MVVKYELQYFPIMGRAEGIRLMLAEAGVDYEDRRISMEQWKSHKAGPGSSICTGDRILAVYNIQKCNAETPFGQMPVLIIDGKHKICQSGAIARYLARELNLYGKTSIQKAYIDMLWDAFRDISSKLPIMETDEKKKRERTKVAIEKTVKPILSAIEAKYKKLGGEFLVGDCITYADLGLMQTADVVDQFEKDYVRDNYPGLSALRDRIAGRERVAAWIKKRPITDI